MIHKKHIAVVAIVSALVWLACKPATEKKAGTEEEKKTTSVNPNGDSELAIVMRTMMDHGKQLKKEIETNVPISPYPASVKTITTAVPTEDMIEDRNIFNGFATFHLATLDSIYKPGADTKKQFNHMVNSCVSCHQNYCQGPIPAIQSLYIKE